MDNILDRLEKICDRHRGKDDSYRVSVPLKLIRDSRFELQETIWDYEELWETLNDPEQLNEWCADVFGRRLL